MLALTAVFISFCFLEEGEGLSNSGSSKGARAAFNFRNTIGVFANQLALGLRTVGFMTFPVAFGLLTDWFTLGFRSLAVSDAMRLFANCDTLRAVEHFASFVWAFYFALRLFAFDIANGVLGFSTRSVAFGGFANRVADGRTVRVITFPGALRVALSYTYAYLSLHKGAGNS